MVSLQRIAITRRFLAARRGFGPMESQVEIVEYWDRFSYGLVTSAIYLQLQSQPYSVLKQLNLRWMLRPAN